MENQSLVEPIISSQQSTKTQTKDEVSPVQLIGSRPKSNNFLVWLLSILLFVSLSITAFFAYQTQKLINDLTELKNISTPVVTIEPSTTVDPTVSWSTYVNDRFTFKHPSYVTINFKIQGQEEITEIKGLEKEIFLVVDPITDHNFYLDKQVSSTIAYNNILWSLRTGSQQYCDGGECGEISDVLQAEHQNKRYTIVLGDLSYPNLDIDQILSTFKFTN